MAEVVVGAFLGSFFQVVFDRLASTNFTDYFHRGKLDNLVEELESTLQSINQVLDDADINQYQFPNVKKWLGDVKHAMYEADQLLDEISSDASFKKMKVESQPSTSNNFLGYVSAFINPFKSRLKELLKNLKHLAEQKDVLDLKNGSKNEVRVSSTPLERLPTTYLVDASQIYGRDDEKDEMVKFLLANNNTGNQTPVCSIVGLGGMGKTTFAKFVYNDSRIEDHFEVKAWVYVSESFDVVGLTKEILKSFHSQVDDGSSLNSLQENLQGILKGKKYLLVLDDIWNGNADCWEQLLLPFNHGSHGSKIIVTTRDKEVAKVLKSTNLINLRHLELPYSIKKMPNNIGSLSNLQTLSHFIVEEKNGSDLKELEKLNHLHGRIHIKGLGNVIDPLDVTTRILKDKKYLEEIVMTFEGGREDMDASTVESYVSVLEALEPNSNLKRLIIKKYKGNRFPNWVSGCHLPNLVSLTLEGLPLLKEISIHNCPKLQRAPLPLLLPSLQRIEIHNCEMLDVAIPNCGNIVELDLHNCKQILINELSSTLKRFSLYKNQYVEFSVEHLTNNPNLEELVLDFKDFVECPSLDLCCYNSLSGLSITGWKSSSLPISLHLFTNLKLLSFHDCPELESFPMGCFPSNLINLRLFNCPKLIATREDWGFLQFTSVVDISFENCPSLEHLPEEWGSVSSLFIRNCPLVKEKYKKEGGERWHTISHIPNVWIDGIRQ